MKNKIILMALVAIVLTGCKEQNTPSNNGGKDAFVDFTYQQTGPLLFSFTNTSNGIDSYKWDFGDGTWAYGKDAMHQYESIGTYTVTLTGTSGNLKYDCRKKITVKKPSIYIAGYTLYKIPYENKYYKVVCKDDDLFTTNWGFTTNYTPLLDNSDIPYSERRSSPLLMNMLDGDNYYTIYVYYATNTSTANDTQCLKQKLTKTAIYQYKDEHILTSDNGQTQIGIMMYYTY